MADQRPRVTGTRHHLPFDELSWEQFEQLCSWLLNEAGYSGVRRIGGSGADDGIDLLATTNDGRRTIVQCKRTSRAYGVGAARREIEKLGALDQLFERYLLIVSHSVTAPAQRAFEDAARDRFEFDAWDRTEVDRRTRESAAADRFFELPTTSARLRFRLPPKNGYFAGREDILAQLVERLRAHRVSAITQLITGLGGVGKTQTAIEYCYRRGETYHDLFWCDASSLESLQRDYADAARIVHVAGAPAAEPEMTDDEAASRFLDGLAARTTPWLVVLDDADRPEQLARLLPRGDRGHVLVTSRARQLPHFGAADPIVLDVLPADEAVAFLCHRSRRGKSSAAIELVEALGGLPLAIEQAAAFLAMHTTLSMREYLDRFHAQRLEILEMASAMEGGYEQTVATTWRLNIRQIEDEAPAAAEVLRGLAFFAPDAIRTDWLHDGLESFGPASQQLAERGVDRLVFSVRVVEPLVRYSLVQCDVATLSVHRLVQDVIRSSLTDEQAEASWWAAYRVLAAAAPEGDGEDPASWASWRPIVGHLLAHSEHLDPSSAEPTFLWNRAGQFAERSGAFRDGQRFHERDLKVSRQILGEEHPDTLTAMSNLAATLRRQGRWDEAQGLDEHVVTARRQALGEEDPDTLAATANLASTLRQQGEWAAARTLYEQVVEGSRRALGVEHPETLLAMGNLAVTLMEQGECAEAKALSLQAVEVQQRVLGADHPNTLIAMANLASIYWSQGEWGEARSLFEQVLSIQRRVLGDEHPDTLTSMNNLAHTLWKQGEWTEARALFEQVVEALRRVVGPEHPHTQIVERNFAAVLETIEATRPSGD